MNGKLLYQFIDVLFSWIKRIAATNSYIIWYRKEQEIDNTDNWIHYPYKSKDSRVQKFNFNITILSLLKIRRRLTSNFKIDIRLIDVIFRLNALT